MWDEVIYQFPNFNVEVWEYISSHTLHLLYNTGWNFSFRSKLQLCSRERLRMDQWLHPTLYWACAITTYLAMLGFKLLHVGKRDLLSRLLHSDVNIHVSTVILWCGDTCVTMGLLPDTQNCEWACAGNAGNVFPVTTGKRSRHASRHVRHVCAVMHAGIAN